MGLSGYHWTDDEVKLLTSLWNEGHTAVVIATQLGTKTRNAVIGKAYRLKLSKPRSKAKGRRRAAARKRRPTPVATNAINASRGSPPLPKPILIPQPVEGGISILDLEHHHCREVVGTGPDGLARYCGAHKEGRIVARSGLSSESPYCARHGAINYQRGLVIR